MPIDSSAGLPCMTGPIGRGRLLQSAALVPRNMPGSQPVLRRGRRLNRDVALGTAGVIVQRAPACNMGLEGLVSKRRDSAYCSGRSPHWVKVKSPASAAMTRAMEVEWPGMAKR